MDAGVDCKALYYEYLAQVEKLIKEKEKLSATDVFRGFNLLHDMVLTAQWYMTSTSRVAADLEHISVKTWVWDIKVLAPAKVQDAFAELHAFAGDMTVAGQYMKSAEGDAIAALETNTNNAKLVGEFLFSTNICDMRLNTVDIDEANYQCARYYQSSRKFFIEPYDYITYRKNKLFDGVTRIKGLFVEAGKHASGWQDEIDGYFGVSSWNASWCEGFVTKQHVQLRGCHFGVNTDLLFCGLKIEGSGFYNKSIYRADPERLVSLPTTATIFARRIATLAVLDMSVDGTVSDFVQKFRVVCYLMCQIWSRISDAGTEAKLKGFVQVFNSDEFPKEFERGTNGTNNPPVTLPDSINLYVAGIDAPAFLRFRDIEHRTKQEFDYITVDIPLITSKGEESFRVVKRNLQDLSRSVMEKISKCSIMRDKELLVQSLYVKEYAVNKAHTLLTAYVEFKPGMSQAVRALRQDKSNRSGKRLDLK